MNDVFRTAWIIGASSGIGRHLAEIMVRDGIKVTASARRDDALKALAEAAPSGSVHVLPLDITDAEAVARAVSGMEKDGTLPDLIILTAAAYEPAGADDLEPELFAKITTVNYLGAVNVLAAVLPAFFDRGHGQIAVTASVAGYRGLPLASAYGPTKAALINLCESLQPECAARGVHLQVINPGFVDTPLTEKNAFPMPFMLAPEDAAARLYRGLRSRRFEVTFPKRFTWIMKALRILPYSLYFGIIGAMTGVRKRAAEKRS